MMSRDSTGESGGTQRENESTTRLFFPPPVPCCFNKARKEGERGEEGGERESRLEVSHKAQAGAFCSNYRQIGDLDISARWSISW